jgi:hypothetical protein
MWIGLSNWEKDVKIFVSHVNANKRWPQEEDLNNQVDRMTTWFCQLSLSLPNWAHEQNGHGGKDWAYAWVQQQQFPLNKTELAVAAAEQQKQHWVLDVVSCSRVISQWPGARLVTSIMEGSVLCPYWNRHLFRVWICLSSM